MRESGVQKERERPAVLPEACAYLVALGVNIEVAHLDAAGGEGVVADFWHP